MKTIIIDINTDGEVAIETLGFKGEACAKATEAIEKAMGVPVSRKKKSEFYQSSIAATQKVGGA